MRKFLAAIPLLFLFSICAHGQGATGSMTAQGATCAVSNACVVTPTLPNDTGGATFTLSGTWSGTVQFEASGDNQTSWVALNVTPSNSTTAVTSATANGTWQANIVGYTNVRLRTSTYSSGTIVGTINPSRTSARSGGGGGGGGSGTVTSITIAGTANQITASGTCTVTTTGTCTLSQPNAVILGTDNSAAGTLQLANGSAAAHTIFASGATTSNTIAGFATAPTTGDLVSCTTVTTTCTLTDSGVLASSVGTVTSVATTTPLGGGTITTTGTLTCATCVTSAASLANGGVVLGTAGTQASGTNTQLTFSAPTLTVGLAGTSSGIIALTGSTSGNATFTAPATAGTRTNAVASSNFLTVPNTFSCNPTSYSFAGSTGYGITFDSTGGRNGVGVCVNGSAAFALYNNGIEMQNNNSYQWAPSTNVDANADTSLSRSAAGVVAVGTGASGNTSGFLKAAGYMSVGTTFTTDTGCGTPSSLAGGATAGKFVGNATSCTTVVTMGNTATAPNGWACKANDLTTTADTVTQTATTTTTATFSGTIVSGDTINFFCIGY